MSSNSSLYVGDLRPDTTEAMLYQKFSSFGVLISIRICRDRSGNSLKYGYVNYSTPESAELALRTLNYEMINGKPIRLMRCQRDPTIRNSGLGNIFVKNLHQNVDSRLMYQAFSVFGTILSCKVAVDGAGNSKCYGFIQFKEVTAANIAIERFNEKIFNEREIYVSTFIPRNERISKFTNIYVNNFGVAFTDENFQQIFSKFGTITSSIVVKNEHGVPKGYGFVAFNDPESAQKAIEEMNGTNVNGCILYVGRAQKKEERQRELAQRFRSINAMRNRNTEGLNLYVKNLGDNIDDNQLHQMFAPFGNITSAKVMMLNGRSRGFGFVCYTTRNEASTAINSMNGRKLTHKPLYVGLAQKKAERAALLANQTILSPTASPFMIQPHNYCSHVHSSVLNNMRPAGIYRPIANPFQPPIRHVNHNIRAGQILPRQPRNCNDRSFLFTGQLPGTSSDVN